MLEKQSYFSGIRLNINQACQLIRWYTCCVGPFRILSTSLDAKKRSQSRISWKDFESEHLSWEVASSRYFSLLYVNL